jgi:hypothetical protein
MMILYVIARPLVVAISKLNPILEIATSLRSSQ